MAGITGAQPRRPARADIFLVAVGLNFLYLCCAGAAAEYFLATHCTMAPAPGYAINARRRYIVTSYTVRSGRSAGEILFCPIHSGLKISGKLFTRIRGLTHINGALLPYVLAPRAGFWGGITHDTARGAVVLPAVLQDPAYVGVCTASLKGPPHAHETVAGRPCRADGPPVPVPRAPLRVRPGRGRAAATGPGHGQGLQPIRHDRLRSPAGSGPSLCEAAGRLDVELGQLNVLQSLDRRGAAGPVSPPAPRAEVPRTGDSSSNPGDPIH